MTDLADVDHDGKVDQVLHLTHGAASRSGLVSGRAAAP